MQCDEIRERFAEWDEPPEHIETCSACAEAWQLHLSLRALKAPLLPDRFDSNVLAALEERGFFEIPGPTFGERVWEHFVRFLLPVALAACALLLLWMGSLAIQKPSADLRALEPEKAKLWSSLPDAVPAPPIPGPAPSGQQLRLVKGDEPR